MSAECHHDAGELCEHRRAALAGELIERGPGVRFDLGALLAWMALGLAFTLLTVVLSINVWRAL